MSNGLSDNGVEPATGSSTGATAALLLLADGRLPIGGHVHSGGVEEAVRDGRIAGVEDLGRYLTGRLWTAGLSDAAVAVAALGLATRGEGGMGAWRLLDAEAASRCAVPVLRAVARSQGRGLLRAARRMWTPAPPVPPGDADVLFDVMGGLHPAGPMWAVALGTVARVAGVDGTGAALVATQNAVAGPAWAAVRLLGLDPFAAAGLLAGLAPAADAVAAIAVRVGGQAWGDLPAGSGPLTDLAAGMHAVQDARLFAS